MLHALPSKIVIFDTQKAPRAKAGRQVSPVFHGRNLPAASHHQGRFMDNIESRKVSAAGGVFRSRQAIIAGVGLAIAAVIVVVARGTIAAPPTLVGKYQYLDRTGKGTVEFLDNGTMVITAGNDSNSGKWEKLDDTRLRIEPPGLGFLGQVCQYKFDGKDALKVSGCDFRMDLTRL